MSRRLWSHLAQRNRQSTTALSVQTAVDGSAPAATAATATKAAITAPMITPTESVTEEIMESVVWRCESTAPKETVRKDKGAAPSEKDDECLPEFIKDGREDAKTDGQKVSVRRTTERGK
jgi:hypothetical protein